MNLLNLRMRIRNYYSISYYLTKKRLEKIDTLEEAVQIAFITLSPSSSTSVSEIVGPKGLIRLQRNTLYIGHGCVAEMVVIDNLSGKDLFGYSWNKKTGVTLQPRWSANPSEWSKKW